MHVSYLIAKHTYFSKCRHGLRVSGWVLGAGKTVSNSQKLRTESFMLDLRKMFQAVWQWNRLVREEVEVENSEAG